MENAQRGAGAVPTGHTTQLLESLRLQRAYAYPFQHQIAARTIK
jgi:hypothetical protein